jgi:hypothetical protein
MTPRLADTTRRDMDGHEDLRFPLSASEPIPTGILQVPYRSKSNGCHHVTNVSNMHIEESHPLHSFSPSPRLPSPVSPAS